MVHKMLLTKGTPLYFGAVFIIRSAIMGFALLSQGGFVRKALTNHNCPEIL